MSAPASANSSNTPNRREVYDYSYDGVMRSLEFSLERLGLDRVDILYVHDLDIFTHGSKAASDARIEEFFTRKAYDAMISLRDQGIVKAIGGGINEWEVCQTLAERGDFDLFLLAGRYTLLEQEALQSFLPLCLSRGIGIALGGPYNSGILARGPSEGAQYNYSDAPQSVIDRVAQIDAVCKRHNVRMIEAALQFTLLHPAVVSVIPGGQSVDEVRSNRQFLDANIPPAFWADHEGFRPHASGRADAMKAPRIDAHQHYWHPARGDYDWMPMDNPILARPYRPGAPCACARNLWHLQNGPRPGRRQH